MSVDGETALYAVLGRPIAHSLSPLLHGAAFRAEARNAVYVACDVGEEELADALRGLRALGAVGVNLTSPLKLRAARLVERLSPAAEEAGAVNTVRFEARGALGHNTDGAGFVAFLARAGVTLAGARVAFLGGGGAALGLVAPLRRAGASGVSCLVREPGRVNADAPAARQAEWLALGGEAGEAAVRAASVVVQATPLGADPGDPLPCPPGWIDRAAVAVDLLYDPGATPWLSALRARGVRAANGLGLLVEQALLSQQFWHGTLPPRSALDEVLGCADPFAPWSPPRRRSGEG